LRAAEAISDQPPVAICGSTVLSRLPKASPISFTRIVLSAEKIAAATAEMIGTPSARVVPLNRLRHAN
jgi:hypothetical protein